MPLWTKKKKRGHMDEEAHSALALPQTNCHRRMQHLINARGSIIVRNHLGVLNTAMLSSGES